MQDDLDIFERQIKDALSDAEVTPPSGSWKRIRKSLDAQEAPARSHWAWAGVSFAAVAIAAVALVTFIPHGSTDISGPAITIPASDITAEADIVPDSEIAPENSCCLEKEASEPVSSAKPTRTARQIAEDRKFIEENTPSGIVSEQNLTAQAEITEPEKIEESIAADKEAEVKAPQENQTTTYFEDPFERMEREDRLAAARNNGRGFSLSADGTLVGNINSGNGRYRQSRATTQQEGKTLSPGVYDAGESTYSIPLTFGLGIKYNLSDRFAIGSGIDYSYLKRSFRGVYLETGGNDDEGIEGDVRHEMHYLGIPISLYYNLLSGEKFHLYLLATGEAEYCLASNYTINADSGGTYNYKEKVSGLQFSAGIGFGADMMLTKNLSLFLDPSAKYYFPSSQPKNIRTDKKFTVGADLGFRFLF